MPEETVWSCAVCGRVLDEYTAQDGDGVVISTHWDHTIGDATRANHPALPVNLPVSQVNLRCDFCHDDTSAFSAHQLITRDVVMSVPATPDEPGESIHMGEVWLADQPCAELILADNWAALLTRGIEGYERRHVQPVELETRTFLAVLYAQVERSVIRLDPPMQLPEETP